MDSRLAGAPDRRGPGSVLVPLPLGAKELAPQGESPAPRAEARNTPFTILPKNAKNRLPHLQEAAMMDNSL